MTFTGSSGGADRAHSRGDLERDDGWSWQGDRAWAGLPCKPSWANVVSGWWGVQDSLPL